jgi:hypothetical protein
MAPLLTSLVAIGDAGNSVCVFVHGFEPYFYIEAPSPCGPDEIDSICDVLNVSSHLPFDSAHPQSGLLPGLNVAVWYPLLPSLGSHTTSQSITNQGRERDGRCLYGVCM